VQLPDSLFQILHVIVGGSADGLVLNPSRQMSNGFDNVFDVETEFRSKFVAVVGFGHSAQHHRQSQLNAQKVLKVLLELFMHIRPKDVSFRHVV